MVFRKVKDDDEVSLFDRYKYRLVREGDKDERVLVSDRLTEIVAVEVVPPRGREDPNCLIHGQISVKVGQSDVPVTLFSRGPDDPALVTLSLPVSPCSPSSYLVLPDLPHDAPPPPPLEALIGSTKLRLTMKLYERTSSGADELIADVNDFEHCSDLEEFMLGTCVWFPVLESKCESQLNEFCFMLGYAVMWGVSAEIEVKINPPMEEGEGGGAPIPKKPKFTVPINAEIEAIQNMVRRYRRSRQSVRTLYNKSELVNAGDKLKLQRSVVCLPMGRQQFLTILVRPDRDDKDNCILVDFPFEPVGMWKFRTNQLLTHSKDVPGTPFSVSIKILNPRENLPEDIRDRFKCPISSWLDDGVLVNLFEQVQEGPESIIVGEM